MPVLAFNLTVMFKTVNKKATNDFIIAAKIFMLFTIFPYLMILLYIFIEKRNIEEDRKTLNQIRLTQFWLNIAFKFFYLVTALCLLIDAYAF